MLGENIKRIRESCGLTQKQLAEMLDISPSAVGMYEQGRRIPDADMLSRICGALRVSADSLFGRNASSVDELIDSLYGALRDGSVMFNGVPLTEEDAEAVLSAMKLGARIALSSRRAGESRD